MSKKKESSDVCQKHLDFPQNLWTVCDLKRKKGECWKCPVATGVKVTPFTKTSVTSAVRQGGGSVISLSARRHLNKCTIQFS